MNKAYSRINWNNQPSTNTALGATNLNRMDIGLNTVDDRVVNMDTTKAEVTAINHLIKSVSYNNSNGVLTFTHQNGTTTIIDTAMEKIVTNFSYNPTTQSIDLILADGSKQSIDISSFINNVDLVTSNTIQFSVDATGKTKAEIINGSITGDKLQTNYLADCQLAKEKSENSANMAKRYAVGGVVSEDVADNAKYYKEQAELARDQAQAIVGVGIANETTPGLVKGGGDVVIEADGTANVPNKIDVNKIAHNAATTQLGFVLGAEVGTDLQNQVTKLNESLKYLGYASNYLHANAGTDLLSYVLANAPTRGILYIKTSTITGIPTNSNIDWSTGFATCEMSADKTIQLTMFNRLTGEKYTNTYWQTGWKGWVNESLQPQKIDWLDTITKTGKYFIEVRADNKHHFPTGNQVSDAYIVDAVVYTDYVALFCGQVAYSRFFYNTLNISNKQLGTPRVLE
ncbi:hypothetical protein [Lachnoclostridium sp.]|uniref:hypothetical protein n=1 Tax=Lachnoclostridium sp. TaxID=2028282 RepID=UPI00289B535D|nr:hypothetical protein [Lachnoclostridium sp.]